MNNPVVWSCGMGLNSFAVAVGLIEHGESYDLAMFADTGGERAATYAAMPVLQEYVGRHGLPPIMRVWKKNEDNSRAITLEQDCLTRKALPSIAYGNFKSCSDQYKIRPQQRVIKAWQPAIQAWERGEKVTMLIGFDAEEGHRMLKSYDSEKFHMRYPLVEWNWDREDCRKAVERGGMPIPAKSSCFFCPNMGTDEILDLAKTEPELMARAVTMEANAELTTIAGLGRKWKWADVLWMDEHQLKMFSDPPEQSCACID